MSGAEEKDPAARLAALAAQNRHLIAQAEALRAELAATREEVIRLSRRRAASGDRGGAGWLARLWRRDG